jgi:single-strand DNA-binding protein
MYGNHVTLTGFLGNDAELRALKNQTSLTTFSVATKRSWRNRESGEWLSHTDWHRCVVFGGLATFAATLMKGTHVTIEGDIRTREYTEKGPKKSGSTKRTITEIRVQRIAKLDRLAKPEGQSAPV